MFNHVNVLIYNLVHLKKKKKKKILALLATKLLMAWMKKNFRLSLEFTTH